MQHDLEEYRYLNDQIKTHQHLVFQIFAISTAASVALLGYGLQNFFMAENGQKISKLAPFIILAPIAIIVPSIFLISAIREDIFSWGAYISVFHEGNKRT